MVRILLVCSLLLFAGCLAQEPAGRTGHAERTRPLVVTKENGVLKVETAGRSCVVADDALDYEVHPSPDGSALAVETLVMSNLQTLRLYTKGADGCFHPCERDAAVELWGELAKKEGFSVEEVERPRMKFLKWTGRRTLLLNLSGETPSGGIDANVTFTLPPRRK